MDSGNVRFKFLFALRQRRLDMAGLRKLKGNYYARVWIPRDSMRPREILVSLRTKMRSQAGKRLREVNKDELEFMERYLSGERLRFWWETETQKTEVQRYNLTEAVDNYLRSRETDRLRKSTLVLYKISLSDSCTPKRSRSQFHNSRLEVFMSGKAIFARGVWTDSPNKSNIVA